MVPILMPDSPRLFPTPPIPWPNSAQWRGPTAEIFQRKGATFPALAATGSDALIVGFALPTSWPKDGLGDFETIASQVPDAATLPPGCLVLLLGAGVLPETLVSRLFGHRLAPVARALLCSALLAKGFGAIGAGDDSSCVGSVVWGRAPAPPEEH